MATGGDPGEDDVELVRVLGNKYSAEILGATDEPRSAQELSDHLDVPIATCYRRIEELSDAGLLTLEDSVLSEERRRVDVYRRGVDRVTLSFGDEGVSVEVEDRSSVKNRIDDAWRTLTE
ncbi:MAG: ArsR/SmtB family transcription factor [Haloferacaceae archaeon]